MSHTHKEARPLLTQAELELFEISTQAGDQRPSGSTLTQLIQRARALRDKYRDTYRRQTAHTRTQADDARDGSENARTRQKADIMAEVLERLEAMRAE